ncbi:kinase-like protein [Sphaerulina musiva SO2202]|uniref:non-specific serine/threonine protein kinase n=1 Tax=Sphaerulina musiva (strain SO2202) TaxID=692275 RepID=M3D2W2_SPHMS|nr:kinase-like protein [Sphaerulina musiva SO2202]EMF11482.1 kinase-like protein [Sphaerulina musiva SO2202]
MALSVLQRAWKPLLRRAWRPLAFTKQSTVSIPANEKIEEETIPGYLAARYYPVRVGEIFQDRYQVVGKLGFGITSTVWLARDMNECRHVALKVYVRAEAIEDELGTEVDVYKRIAKSPSHHPGRGAVRSLFDSFILDGPNGRHQCLVHQPLWESVLAVKHRNPAGRLPASVLAHILKRLFHALDLLHQECHVAHTDIKEANILLGADKSVLVQFEKDELMEPSPKKELDDGVVYVSRELGIPKEFGEPMLCDFGSAVPLDDGIEHREDIQPDVYRSPEVILEIPWTYSVDIWNVGCMVWDAFEGEHLFTGQDPLENKYRGRAHLAEMIALLGPPPPSLLARAKLRDKFFSDQGEFSVGIPLPASRSLEERETTLRATEDNNEEDRASFLRFMRKMLQWEPEQRSSARDLAEDEWILRHTT